MKNRMMTGFTAGFVVGTLWALMLVQFTAVRETGRSGDEARGAARAEWKRVGPFSGWVWLGEREAAVLVDGRWYGLEGVNGRSVERLLAAAAEAFGPGEARKRVAEDLYEVLTVAEGHAPGDAVDLTLTHPETGERVTLRDVAMTRDKRQSARWARWKETEGVPRPPGGAFDFMERRG